MIEWLTLFPKELEWSELQKRHLVTEDDLYVYIGRYFF